VRDVRQAVESESGYPEVLFFYLGSVEEGEGFFARHWPTARAVADSGQRFYAAFGLVHGGLLQLFGPSVWMAALRAALRGNGVGRPVGDPLTMPGILLIEGDRILWRHPLRHIGDQPDFRKIPHIV